MKAIIKGFIGLVFLCGCLGCGGLYGYIASGIIAIGSVVIDRIIPNWFAD
jgi:hypothetical protein